MTGAKGGRRRQTLRVTGEGVAGKVDEEGKRSGERRNLCGTRRFQYDRTETGDAQVGG